MALSLVINSFLKLGPLPFGLETALKMLPYALLGYGIGERLLVIPLPNSRILRFLPAIPLGALCFALACFYNVILESAPGLGSSVITQLASCCGILAVYYLCNALPAWAPLSYIGRSSLVILLLHKFPVIFFQVLFSPTRQLLQELNILGGLVVSIVSTVLCLLAGFILEKICPWVIGKTRKKAQPVA